MGEVTAIDLTEREVSCDDSRVSCDYLIIATGSITCYFSIPGAREVSFPLKNLAEGVALRSHILRCFEAAVNERDQEIRCRKLNFVIVWGGGATGVEFAGALAELVRGPLARDFPRLDLQEVSISVIEARDRLLATLTPRLSAYTQKKPAEKGIDVLLGERVIEVAPQAVKLASGRTLATETVVWSSGVRGDDRVRA